ncbi:hypothetical protein BpHYR1_041759 [Brachionus plicatilis]|uniref:Uncharacterized protein n=1 Tax=Brachionus plicatilis TaxID=10195 RepID=A0A3M7RVU1_BRAPC|nr:hypothetical protein BpHYR1_041759 [Brachionus plicatilis]
MYEKYETYFDMETALQKINNSIERNIWSLKPVIKQEDFKNSLFYFETSKINLDCHIPCTQGLSLSLSLLYLYIVLMLVLR